MNHYDAPLRDMKFVINELAGLDAVASLPGYEDADVETVDAILAEAARFSSEVIAPINQAGDMHGCRLVDGCVSTPPGVQHAYRDDSDIDNDNDNEASFMRDKLNTARFYADQLLVQVDGLRTIVTDGAQGVLAFDESLS
jgi:Acyl-CoA dehydrogenase N terminal/Acetyl-CoA dehydrogenase C-terminal like